MSSSQGFESGTLKQALAQARELLDQRAFKAVLAQVREIQKQFPHDLEAGYIGCVALRQLGEGQSALKELEGLLGRAGEVAPLLYEKALLLRGTGAGIESTRLLERVVALEPKHAGAWQALGEQLADRGDLEGADRAFRQQMATASLHPGLIEAVRLVSEGKLGMAEGICRDYLYRYPTDVNAIRLLADVGLQLEIHDDAAKLLRRCLELAPDYHLARNNYASALSKGNRFSEALEQLDILERAEPENLSHPILAASVLVNVGDFTGAIERYERVLERAPGHALLQMSYGHALKTVGRRADCENAYLRAIAAQPDLGEAYWSLANLKTFRFTPQQIDTLRRELNEHLPHEASEERSQTLVERDEFHMCFALGKALEDRKEYSESFDYYARGNAIKKRASSYDAQANTEELTAIAESCVAQRFAARRGYGVADPDPIFIVGLPRSGSTLLEQILASHSQVDGTMELPNILQFVRRLADRKNRSDSSRYPEALWQLDASECAALGQEYLDVTRVQRKGAPFFIDKMPNNFAHVGLIQLILPNAKIIDARRGPWSACFSGFKQLFAAGQEFTYSLEDIGRYYFDYTTLMDHWDLVLPDKVLRVDYEAVVTDLETQVRRMLDYCELGFEPSCLQFHANERAVRTASSEQVRQPIYASALAQWQHFQAFLAPELTPVLGPPDTEWQ